MPLTVALLFAAVVIALAVVVGAALIADALKILAARIGAHTEVVRILCAPRAARESREAKVVELGPRWTRPQ